MRRKFHISDDTYPGIKIADETGAVVCTLPWQELRLAKFIVASLNVFGFNIKRYDREDWLWGRNNVKDKTA